MKFLFSIFLLAALLCSGCKDSDPNAPGNFDRSAMLRNYADNLIVPAYSNLEDKVQDLLFSWAVFDLTPSQAYLDDVRSKWAVAYAAWQSANAYNFGPAGEEGLRKGLIEEVGTFPANVVKIEEFIAAGDTALNNFNRDTRGFLAIEYLLFDEANGSLLASAPRRAYASAIIDHLQSRIYAASEAWGDYRQAFLAADGTDVGSSTSLLYNEFVRSFEGIKNFKVGLPAGKRPGQTQAEPQLVEAYYSAESLEMMKLHIQSIENIYYGKGAGQDGLGLKDYLEKVVGGTELVLASAAQWAKVKAALEAVPTDQPLSALIANNHPSIDTLHTELQKHTRFFKSDMSSLLGIAITFSSGDGD
jgi:hypothetical protein